MQPGENFALDRMTGLALRHLDLVSFDDAVLRQTNTGKNAAA
jgi:hypothetical protein